MKDQPGAVGFLTVHLGCHLPDCEDLLGAIGIIERIGNRCHLDVFPRGITDPCGLAVLDPVASFLRARSLGVSRHNQGRPGGMDKREQRDPVVIAPAIGESGTLLVEFLTPGFETCELREETFF